MRTCLGFAITTFLTCGAITAAYRGCVASRFDDDHVLLGEFLCESLEKMTAHVDAPHSFELALVPGDRLGEGAMDIQSNDAHACSSVSVRSKRKLAGDTTSTDSRSRRIRESRKGRPCNELGLSAHCLSTACPHLRAPGAPRPGWAHGNAVSLLETGGNRGAAHLIPDQRRCRSHLVERQGGPRARDRPRRRASAVVALAGIIDSHRFMPALRCDAEAQGTVIAFETPVLAGRAVLRLSRRDMSRHSPDAASVDRLW